MAPASEPPSAVHVTCPDCADETLHTVLKGTLGTRGGFTLDATVQCTECHRVHHAIVREPAPVSVPVVVSVGSTSRRTRIELAGDEDLGIGEGLIIDGVNCRLTGIETKDLKRVDAANITEVLTLWAKEFEELPIGFAINLGHKTITKTIPCTPETDFTVGDEHLFGRLRVTVHAIKTKERLLKRGTAEAGDIVRVFAKPTPLGSATIRPDKKTREQLRDKEDRKARRAEGGR